MKKVKKWNLVVVYVLLAAVIIILAVQQFTTTPIEQGKWECAQTACARTMTEQEIAASVCAENEAGEMICSVNVDGEEALVPLNQLNLTGLSFCAEYVCIKEVKSRDVNYAVNVTFA